MRSLPPLNSLAPEHEREATLRGAIHIREPKKPLTRRSPRTRKHFPTTPLLCLNLTDEALQESDRTAKAVTLAARAPVTLGRTRAESDRMPASRP